MSLEATSFVICSQVRNFLHTTAQEVAHFSWFFIGLASRKVNRWPQSLDLYGLHESWHEV
jgi:hypothetical protein